MLSDPDDDAVEEEAETITFSIKFFQSALHLHPIIPSASTEFKQARLTDRERTWEQALLSDTLVGATLPWQPKHAFLHTPPLRPNRPQRKELHRIDRSRRRRFQVRTEQKQSVSALVRAE